jgi:hypothetical protein
LQRRNAAIVAAAAASIAANQPTRMLVTFRVPEQAVVDQAGAISTRAAAEGMPPAEVLTAARQQVNAVVKARVLGGAAMQQQVRPGGHTRGPAVSGAPPGAAAQGSGGGRAGHVAVVADYLNLPITLVSISSAAQLAALRAHPDVVSVVADRVVQPLLMNGLGLIGWPDVAAAGITGQGTVAVLDTGGLVGATQSTQGAAAYSHSCGCAQVAPMGQQCALPCSHCKHPPTQTHCV